MGCATSQIEKEERVQVCKERKMLMKQLLGFREEYANVIVAYFKALRNTGVTLRQFTESESSEIENIPFSPGLLPSSSPHRLPPSPPPPPPPPFSPDLKGKRPMNQNSNHVQEERIETNQDNISWDPMQFFEHSLAQHEVLSVAVGEVDEENWAETLSQFEEDEQENGTSDKRHDALIQRNVLGRDLVDDDLLMVSGDIKDDTTVVLWRNKKKTLTGIVRELDDYFLKASSGGKEIAVLIDLGAKDTYLHHDHKESKGKGNSSARVLSSLPWGWSSRSMNLMSDTVDNGIPFEPCKPGANRITLEKLYAQEQILYKAVKEEEMAKLEYERKSTSLNKQEVDNFDQSKIEKTRFVVQNLQSEIARLQELVRSTSSCVLALINEELHLQLVALLTGLIHMWKTMCECHIAQHHISQQVKHLSNHQNTEPTSEYHRDATVQLENEVNFWYNSFNKFTKSQRQYVSSLCRWIELVNGENQNRRPCKVRTLCEKWKLALDRMPEQAVSEAIKSFLSVIRAILKQQEEELNLKKKSDKIKRRLEKELYSLMQMEKRLEESLTLGGDTDMETNLSPKHPVSKKCVKIDALRKCHEEERAKHLSSIEVTRAMTLNNLHASLPPLFQALMGFSSACSQAFDGALGHAMNEQASDVEQSHVDC